MRIVALVVPCLLLASAARAQVLMTCHPLPEDPGAVACRAPDDSPVRVVRFGEAIVGVAGTPQDAHAWLRLTNTYPVTQRITYTIYPDDALPIARAIDLPSGESRGIPLHEDTALAGRHVPFALEVRFINGHGMAALTVRSASDPWWKAMPIPPDATP